MAAVAILKKIQKQSCIFDLKWREMRSKVIFGHPKWPKSDFQNGCRRPFWKKNQTKVVYWSKMARNAFKSDFRSSKMAAGSHFVENKSNKVKVAYWSEMARNAIESDFRSSIMAAGSHFVRKKSDFREKWFSVIQNGGGGGITMASL